MPRPKKKVGPGEGAPQTQAIGWDQNRHPQYTADQQDAHREAEKILLRCEKIDQAEADRLIALALRRGKFRQLEADGLAQSHAVYTAASALTLAVEGAQALACDDFAVAVPVEENFLENLRGLQASARKLTADLARMERDLFPTDHTVRVLGKGRPRLPVQVVALHIEAKVIIDGHSLGLRGRKPANVARLGALLCRIAGLKLKGDASTKAADLACFPAKLRAYGLLPYSLLIFAENGV